MASTIPHNFNFQPIRSIISSKYLKPTEWIDEIEKYELQYDELIGIIEIYEFIIAIIVKAISFTNIGGLLINEIQKVLINFNYYTKKYFNGMKEYIPLYRILYFVYINNNFEYGIEKNEDETKIFYQCLDKYYEYIFGEVGDNKEGKKLLIQKCKDSEKYDNFNKSLKYVKIPIINDNGILNDLAYFERKKQNIRVLNSSNIHTRKKRNGI